MLTSYFNYPQYLYGLLLLLPLIGVYLYSLNKGTAVIKFSSLFFLQNNKSSLRVTLRHVPFILRLSTLALLIFISAQPIKKEGAHNIEKEGINIVLALDISTSMKETDLAPNRLEVAKAKAQQFIAKRGTDRIGLVLFGSDALLKCPLTLDHQVLTAFVKNVNFLREISSQTAIGNAIAMAIIALKRGRPTYSPSSATSSFLLPPTATYIDIATATDQFSSPKIYPATTHKQTSQNSQVIVLITDGRNTSTELDPLTAAQIAQALGIKIYTIGIGRPTRAFSSPPPAQQDQLPLPPVFQNQSRIDEQTLRKVAALTAGKYFNVQDSRALDLTFKEIDKLEKVVFEEKKFLKQNTRYLPLAYAVLVLFILELFCALLLVRKNPA